MELESVIFIVGFWIFLLIAYLLLKNDVDKNKRLTKKGYKKFGVILLVGCPVFFTLMWLLNTSIFVD